MMCCCSWSGSRTKDWPWRSRATPSGTGAATFSHGRSRQWRCSRPWCSGAGLSDARHRPCARRCCRWWRLPARRSPRTKHRPFRPTAAGSCSSGTTPPESNCSTLVRSTWPPPLSRWQTRTAPRCPSGHRTAKRSRSSPRASSRGSTWERDKSRRSLTREAPEAAPGTRTMSFCSCHALAPVCTASPRRGASPRP